MADVQPFSEFLATNPDYSARRDYYRQMAKDPDFQKLSPQDRLDVSRRVLFPEGKQESPLAAPVKQVTETMNKMVPFPGALKAMFKPEELPEQAYQHEMIDPNKGWYNENLKRKGLDLGYVLNPMPEAVSEGFGTAVEGIRNLFGHNAAKLAEDTLANVPVMPASGIQSLKNLRLYGMPKSWRGEYTARDLSGMRDVTPEAPKRLAAPEVATPVEAAQPLIPGPTRPGLMSPAQTSAGVFERQLAAEEALRQSDRGAKLLRAQLQTQAAPPETAVAIQPQVSPTPTVEKPISPKSVSKTGRKTKAKIPAPALPQPEAPAVDTYPPGIAGQIQKYLKEEEGVDIPVGYAEQPSLTAPAMID